MEISGILLWRIVSLWSSFKMEGFLFSVKYERVSNVHSKFHMHHFGDFWIFGRTCNLGWWKKWKQFLKESLVDWNFILAHALLKPWSKNNPSLIVNFKKFYKAKYNSKFNETNAIGKKTHSLTPLFKNKFLLVKNTWKLNPHSSPDERQQLQKWYGQRSRGCQFPPITL